MNQSTKLLQLREGGYGKRYGYMDVVEIDAEKLEFLIDAAIFEWVGKHPDYLYINCEHDSIRKIFGSSRTAYM